MENAIRLAATYAGWAFNAMALVFLCAGCAEGFVQGLWVQLNAHATRHQRRAVRQRFLNWIVLALTFQLAADLATTAVSTSWSDVGKLAAVAGIRTFLNFFLERDLNEIREVQHETAARI